MNRFQDYIKSVEKGKTPACNLVKLAIDRHNRDLKRDGKDLKWKPEEGYKIVHRIEKYFRFYNKQWAHKPVKLEPWQVFSLMLRYGWFWDDGTMRFIKSYEEIARKNGKSIKKGWESLFHVMTGGPFSAVYNGATTESQARIVVNAAGQTALHSPEIKKFFHPFYYQKQVAKLAYEPKESTIDTLTSQAGKQDGLEPTYGIMDEYHEHPNSKLYDVIISGMGVGDNPMMDIITTAGFDKTGPCYEKRKQAIDVLEGKTIDDDLFTLIYTIDELEGDGWKDENEWYKANPNLGVSIPIKTMRAFFREAEKGGSAEVNFKTKHLNLWTDAASVWIPSDKIALCQKGPINIDRRRAFGGIQLAATRGINCFCLCLPREDGGEDYKLFSWLPKGIALEHDLKDSFLKWEEDNWITLTDGNVIDYDFIISKIKEVRLQCELVNIQFAPQYESSLMPLLDDGIELIKCANNYTNMTNVIGKFEGRVEEQAINHEGNPVLAWMMGHVALKHGPDKTVRIDKEESLGPVPGPVAMLMSYKGLLNYKMEPSPGVY